MAKRILGVGQACVDQLFIWEDSARPVNDNQLKKYEVQAGGMSATALVAASRLGAETEYWGVVGQGPSGEFLLNELRREGVDVSQAYRSKEGDGPVSIVCVDGKTGERNFYRGKMVPDTSEPFGDLDRISTVGCVLVDGVRPAAGIRAAKKARELGIPVVGDVGNIGVFLEENNELFPLVDYVIASEPYIKARGLGDDLEKACLTLLEHNPRLAAITCGEKGVIYSEGDGIERLEAFRVPVVDTTGAGDSFHGAFCVGLIQGLSVRDNVTFSSAVAALKCGKAGGQSGLPTLDEVKEFLQKQEKEISGIT